MSLINALFERPNILNAPSRYCVMNGCVYFSIGVILVLWPGAVQVLLRDRAFVGDEQGLVRAIGLAVAVIGWQYVFGGRTGARQFVAASVMDRLIFVPAVLIPLALAGVFPHVCVAFTVLEMSLAAGAWLLLRRK